MYLIVEKYILLNIIVYIALQMNIPKKLLPSHGSTKYEVRFRSLKPPPPYTPIQLCLVDNKENGILYRTLYEDTKEIYEFMGPEINIEGIYLAPEQDSWKLEEVTISYKDLTASFPYYGILGARTKDAAIYLPVFYKLKIDMKPLYDAEYIIFKDKVLQYTIELSFAGSLVINYLSTIEKGFAFGIGGTIGYMYVSLLEMNIDNLGKNQSTFIVQLFRLGTISAVAIAFIQRYHVEISQDHTYFLLGVFGFMMHRIALIISYLKK